MIDFRKEIANRISKLTNISSDELYEYIEIPPSRKMGDYAFPCFRLAKELKKAPPVIAKELMESLSEDEIISKIDVAGGYLNFYVNISSMATEVLNEIAKQGDKYGSSDEVNGKHIVIEYSSPNIAKPMHIGHLRNTILGGALYKIYRFLGYNVVGINHLGDWGINFAKIMAGYSMWKDEYDFSDSSLESIVKIYVRYNELEKEDSQYTEIARQWHIKLEAGDKEAVQLWNWLREISLKEANKIYDLLDCRFDSYNGEAFYNDKMDDIINELKAKNLLVESEGAQIVDLDKYNMPPCIVLTSSGTTLYATRDIAALKYRINTYDFDKMLYVVGSEQQLHFKQIFKVFELMGYEEYAKNCEHIYYGMILDNEGKKMGTRKGTSLNLIDLLYEAMSKSKNIIQEKGTKVDNEDLLAKQIGIGAIIFNVLNNTKIKDVTFDWDSVLNFNGETGPYIQYIYVRTRSVLEKAGYTPKIEDVDFSKLCDESSIDVIKLIYSFGEVVKQSAEKCEPFIISRFLIELAGAFSRFYNENKIIGEEKAVQNSRLYLTYATGLVLKESSELLGIKMPDRM